LNTEPKDPSPKKRLFEQFARVAKSLASANRLELLEALAQGERGVDALSQASGMSVANTSHHLQILREGGLVQSRKDGLQVIYRLAGDDVLHLISAMHLVAETHLAEVDRIVRENFEIKDNLTPLRREELLEQVRAGVAMVIDVRRVISKARSISPWTPCPSAWINSPAIRKSSPTAVGHIACWLLTP
jgi:DNA-binding transcriptional ArsR family regulator